MSSRVDWLLTESQHQSRRFQQGGNEVYLSIRDERGWGKDANVGFFFSQAVIRACGS
jgi:hypothetical protein